MRTQLGLAIDAVITERLRRYASALEHAGHPVTLAGLVEAALIEYLDRRCTLDGLPRARSDPAPIPSYAGRGRPSRAARASRPTPALERTVGRRADSQRPLIARALRPQAVTFVTGLPRTLLKE